MASNLENVNSLISRGIDIPDTSPYFAMQDSLARILDNYESIISRGIPDIPSNSALLAMQERISSFQLKFNDMLLSGIPEPYWMQDFQKDNHLSSVTDNLPSMEEPYVDDEEETLDDSDTE